MLKIKRIIGEKLYIFKSIPEFSTKKVTLYNIIFPLWLLWLFPVTWIVILPANFLIDLAVLVITMRCLKLSGRKETAGRSIWKIWLFGFFSDFVGTFFMFLVNIIDSLLDYQHYQSPARQWWYNNMTNAVTFNPFSTLPAFLWSAACILLSGVCIYLFNFHFSLKKAVPDSVIRKKLALSLSVFTAPYLFLLPTSWFYM